MPKFTFICENKDYYTEDIQSKITTEFEVDGLDDVVEEFERFLKGSGFVFDGQLNFVKEEDFSDDIKLSEDDGTFYLDPQSMNDPFPFFAEDSVTITSQQPEMSNGILHFSV